MNLITAGIQNPLHHSTVTEFTYGHSIEPQNLQSPPLLTSIRPKHLTFQIKLTYFFFLTKESSKHNHTIIIAKLHNKWHATDKSE